MPEVRNRFVNWTFENAEKRKPAKKAWDSMTTTFDIKPMPSSSSPKCQQAPSKMDLAYLLN